MANTKQQRKRVRITRRESQENLRYSSRIKTMFRSLTVAAQEDEKRAAELGVELVSVIDKAAARGVIHKRNAAKKKARVYSIVQIPEGQGKPKQPATTEAVNEQTRTQRRGERRVARKAKKDETRARQKARTDAEAEADKKIEAAEADKKIEAAEAEKKAEADAEPATEEVAEETADAAEEVNEEAAKEGSEEE